MQTLDFNITIIDRVGEMCGGPACHSPAWWPFVHDDDGFAGLHQAVRGGETRDAGPDDTDICMRAHELGLPVHMDGARIFNAAAVLERSVASITKHCDSVMFCLSKGLGAPVGSMLVGSKDFIAKAHRFRKTFGGGMRQAGVLAAAGLVALEESPKGLKKDHENARYLAAELAKLPGITLDASKVVTNIVRFDVSGTGRTAAEICGELKKRNVYAGPFAKYAIRMVTHFDVDRAGIDKALAALREILVS